MLYKSLLSLLVVLCLSQAGCAFWRIDSMHVLLRSDQITSAEQEREVLSRAKLSWTQDGKVRVLYLKGTPYERGYQHGALLRQEVRDNLLEMYQQASKKFLGQELFAEAFERLRPFISQEYHEEMHGLAHGSKLPLHVIQAIHALPEMSEWGGKKRIKELAKSMMAGADLGTSCSNFNVAGASTADGGFYTVRVLDWGLHRISKLHEYPLLTINEGDDLRAASLNIGWVGFLGAVSGMSEQGITLGEMGYGDPEGETLRGKPMIFLLRDILSYARNVDDAERIIGESTGTCSYVYLISDGKSRQARMFVRDATRLLSFNPGQEIQDKEELIPALPGTLYGGHYTDRMTQQLSTRRGQLEPESIMQSVIPEIAMPSNFQNVLYDPVALRIWVSNAASASQRAAEQPYTAFDLAGELREFRR